MKTVKVVTNAGRIGFFAGFLGFALWSYLGNISSSNIMHMSLFDYLSSPKDSALIMGQGLEIQDVLISLVLIALVAGFIFRFIFSLLVRTHFIHLAAREENLDKEEHETVPNV